MKNWLNETALRLRPTLPTGWHWYSFERGGPWPDSQLPPDAIRLVGCVPSRHYTKGPRKGRPVWSEPMAGTKNAVFFTLSDIDETERLYEEATGLCSRCQGTKSQWAGWDRKTGDRFVPCRKCGETGKTITSSGGGRALREITEGGK